MDIDQRIVDPVRDLEVEQQRTTTSPARCGATQGLREELAPTSMRAELNGPIDRSASGERQRVRHPVRSGNTHSSLWNFTNTAKSPRMGRSGYTHVRCPVRAVLQSCEGQLRRAERSQELPLAWWLRQRGDGEFTGWDDWLQRYRIELNAMPPADRIAWLTEKIERYPPRKVVPPPWVLHVERVGRARAEIGYELTKRARIDERTEELLGEIEWPAQAQFAAAGHQVPGSPPQGGLAKSDESLRRQGGEAAARMRRRRQAGCLYLSNGNPAAGPKQVALAGDYNVMPTEPRRGKSRIPTSAGSCASRCWRPTSAYTLLPS